MNIQQTFRSWLRIPNEDQEKQMLLEMETDSVNDFERVIYTLGSSIHEAHIKTAENMFVAFKTKWGVLPRQIMEYNEVIFNREREKVFNKLRALDFAYNISQLTICDKERVELLLT
jgi:hypothetical protein